MLKIGQLQSFFKDKEQSKRILSRDYGKDYPHLELKRHNILNLLNFYRDNFPNEEKVVLYRIPGRINLMGRHIDHQGGCVNLIAIDKEIFIIASKRTDQKITAYNIDLNRFSDVFLDLSDYRNKIGNDWNQFINNEDLINRIRAPNGSWENYLKGAYLRLINHFQDQDVYGANLCVSGDIPIASGLSSSSALTVGAFQILSHLNKLNLQEETIIKLCAEAEWFVGTRGGAADHAAILLAKKRRVLHVKFFEFELLTHAIFPRDLDLIVCDTNIVADKSGSKKDKYNKKVLAYELGFKLLKKILPNSKKNILYLRDVSPEGLQLSLKELLNYLNKIPEYIKISRLSDYFGDEASYILKKYDFTSLPLKIALKKILIYGISECQRSKLFIEALKSRDLKKIGYLMKLSHNGDRKFIFEEDTGVRKYDKNSAVNLLKENSKKKLHQFSGGYGCSIKEIDFLVDKAVNYPGVIGAQLSGAGYGGCAMIIVRKNYTDRLKAELKEKYYNFFDSQLKIYEITPVNGFSYIV